MRYAVAAIALVALAACGQTTEPAATDQPEAPQTLSERLHALPEANQIAFAFEQLQAYQTAHPEAVQPPCTAVRGTESRGVIPENVAPDSVYAAYVGANVYSVQCGPQISMTAYDPREHWLVAFAPGAEEVAVVSCADANGRDRCPRQVPTVAVEPASTPAP